MLPSRSFQAKPESVDVYKRQGLECVKKLLAKLGVTHVTVVPEQETPVGIREIGRAHV